ncbi:MAG: NAD(P)H-dependent oxidoreductase, partial [Spirochaetaceae bacterium]|nr:NAD(P)H-dependent oxidoreductase [Spirochaetaceae bacterium]
MKTLVIYYSYEGNSEFVAAQIKAALGADLLRIETEDDRKRTGLSKFIWGGKQVFSRALPELKPYEVDIGAYDLIILGCPVWAGSPAPALRSFLARTPVKDKRIALFVCHGGGKGETLEKLKRELPGNTFVGDLDLANPLKGDAAAVKERIN